MSEAATPPVAKVAKARKPRRSGQRPYVLPESLTIRFAKETALALGAASKAGMPVLDGSAVAEADTAGLQLLAAAAQQAGGSLRWSAASSSLCAAAATLGLGEFLGLAEVSGQFEQRGEPG